MTHNRESIDIRSKKFLYNQSQALQTAPLKIYRLLIDFPHHLKIFLEINISYNVVTSLL